MKVICIGRNYIDHAKEMNSPIPKKPLVFMKPSTAVVKTGIDFYIPDFSSNVHFELELVLKISKNGKHIQEKYAKDYYQEIGLGIDFTARDIQEECKAKGHPWEIAKSFDNSALLSDFVDKNTLVEDDISFQLTQNDVIKQNGNSKDLIFSFDYLISYVSQYFTLNRGDYLFTGTPAGVGPVNIGDKLEGMLNDKALLTCYIK